MQTSGQTKRGKGHMEIRSRLYLSASQPILIKMIQDPKKARTAQMQKWSENCEGGQVPQK